MNIEDEHLETLGTKYCITDIAMGAFWVLHCILQRKSLISLEYWLRSYKEHKK